MEKLSKHIALLIVVSVSSFGPCAAADSKLDVRLLIDVSGSMKLNDPENLRIAAVGLVAELIPPGATAGIWMFAERVEQLMAPREVDSEWKKSASKSAKKIHSRGQFTDIEAAISQSTRTWLSDPDSDRAMHLILLTDGVVDVAKDTVVNAESRDRILNSMLDQLAQRGVKIHTVALSKNADGELLTSLAETTEAWSEQVDDAASLQRAFLHMFEQAASPDSVPLNGKQFEVDSSISEMTLLIFHSPSDEPLQLTSPTGDVFDAGHVNGGLHWRVENGYELVTVTAPKVGTWQINADPDPDNRVLIVTDVKLAVTPLPSNFVVNDSLTVDARLTERGTPIVRGDFLKILEARAEISNSEKSNRIEIPLTLDEAHASFSAQRVVDWEAGDYDYIVTVDSGTFQRQYRSKVRVNAAPLTFSSVVVDEGTTIEIAVESEPELIEQTTLAGFAVVAKPDGSTEVIDLPPSSDTGLKFAIPAPLGGIYRVQLHVMGRRADDQTFTVKSPQLSAEISGPPVTNLENSATDVAIDSASIVPKIDWLRSGAVVLIANAAIATILAVLWFLLGQRRRVPDAEVVLE